MPKPSETLRTANEHLARTIESCAAPLLSNVVVAALPISGELKLAWALLTLGSVGIRVTVGLVAWLVRKWPLN